jgi:hypothetical protein
VETFSFCDIFHSTTISHLFSIGDLICQAVVKQPTTAALQSHLVSLFQNAPVDLWQAYHRGLVVLFAD